MPGNFWARKDDKFEVVGSAPSVNLTQVGNAIVPIPYPVVSKSKLNISSDTVPYILLGGKEAFVKRSHTTNVKGDEKGSKGGVVSGTVSEKAEPITFDATVKGDGDFMIRDAEQFFMNNKNTVGKMTTTLGGSGSAVNAGGDVSGPASPADVGGQGSDAWSQALSALKDPMGAFAKLQDMKSKYDTVAGMINGDIPFSAAGLAGAVGGLTGNQSLMQASSMISKAETAKKMLDGDIPFSPAFAMGLAGSATGNPSLMKAAQTVGQAEGAYNKVDNAYGSKGKTPTSSSPKPSASALTKMIKSDTVNNFGKTLLGAMPSSEKPTLSMAMSGLGSLMGSPILLATAQSTHVYSFPPLLGVFPIDLNITYVSDLFYQGIFGNNRRHSYEKQFYALKGNSYRLDLPDGRWFNFIKQVDGSFKDKGSLGVKVKQIDEQTFELYYLKTATTEYYHKKYLRVIEESNKNSITLSYQETKNPKIELLKKIENNSKASWTFTYDEDELLKSISDHAGRVWSFRYADEKYLKSIVFNKELEESYGYDLIERKNLPKQQVLSLVIDSNERAKLSFSYNQKGEVKGYAEDEQSYEYVWHSLEQVEKTNASGISIFYGLDDTKRVTAITHPDGSYVKETWDNETNIANIKTRGGAKVVKSYDEQGRLLSVVKNEELVESFNYEALNPKPIEHTKEGKSTAYEYDKAYNLIAIVLANKATHTYAYTKEGLLCSSKDALGNETLFEYNKQGLLHKQIDALKNPTTLTYDKLGRVVAITLANEQKHHYQYNHANQIINYENPQGENMEFTYSKSAKLLSLKDPAKRLTEFRYDEYERVIAKVYPYLEEQEQQTEYYAYNKDNSLSSIKRVDGTSLYFNYDENQNVIKILADNHEGEVESLSYTYDTLSNLVKAVSNNNRVLLEYDANSQITAQNQNGLDVQSFYDEKHKQLSSLNFLDHTQNYQYDKQNKLNKVINNQEEVIEFKYDKNEVLSQRKYPNKTKEKYAYDEAYNLIEIEAKESNIYYGYNELGEIRTKWNKKDDDAKLYRYNPRGELIQAGADDFSYGAAGNKIDKGWEYNYQNQLIQNNKYNYGYDARGNLQSKIDKETKEQTRYSFNLFNQLLSVKKFNEAKEEIESFSYAYDALNRRVKKTHITPNTQNTYHYLYDEHNIIAILDKNKEKLATIVHDRAIDTPLSITIHQNPLRELTLVEESYYHELPKEEKNFIDQKRRKRTYYYNRDHQGSIHNLSNEDGKVVESFRYDESYGTITSHTKTEETLNPYCYTGREFETDELYYYRARYYDPSIGRFISQDPIEFLAGDFNFYRYVGNSPVGWVDPFGLAEEYMDNHTTMTANQPSFHGSEIRAYEEPGYFGQMANIYRSSDYVPATVTLTNALQATISLVLPTQEIESAVKAGTEGNYGELATQGGMAILQTGAGKAVGKVVDIIPNSVKNKIEEVVEEGKKKISKVIERKDNKIDGDSKTSLPKANEAGGGDGTKAVEGSSGKSGSSSPDTKKTDKEKGEQEAKNKKDCPTAGKPINPLTGIKVLTETADLVIDAPLPLIWQRSYASDNKPTMLLGQGWRLDIEFTLEEREAHVVFADEMGREVLFKHMEVGKEQLFVKEKMLLSHPTKNEYKLKNPNGTIYHFRKSTNNHLIYNIFRIEDQNGNQLNFFHNKEGNLVEYISTDNHRLFEVEYHTEKIVGTRLLGLTEIELDYQNEQQQLIETKEGRKLFLKYVQDENQIIHLNGVNKIDEEEEKELKRVYKLRSEKVNSRQLFFYEYSKEGDLVSVLNSFSEKKRIFEYKNHIMTAHKVPNGLESFYNYTEYTPKGKVLKNHTNFGESWNFEYHDGQTKVTDNLGRKKQYYFDNDDYPIALVNALGEKKSIEYNDDGLPNKIINEAGDIKEYIYNAEGYPIVIRDNGSNTQISYDDEHKLPSEIIDDGGNTTKLEYDKRANLINETLPDGSSTEYTRDSRGFPIAIKDALGNTSSLQFDLSGNLTQYSDALGNSSYYSYDREGKLLNLKDALGKNTQYSYNPKELLSGISYADGTNEAFEYNEKSQLIAHTNQEGTKTKYELDQQGRVEKRVNALNHTLSYSYDQAGRVKALINENGSNYHFEYDALDRLTKEIGIDGLITNYEYSPLGTVTKKTEAVGTEDERVTHYKRDKQHQLIEKEIRANKEESLVSTYEYDIIGQLSKAINPTAKVRLEYDALGRIKEERTAILGLEEARVLSHEYDALGNRVKTTLPTKQTIAWEYNEIQQLEKISLDGKEVSSYQRDALNQELSRTQGALETLNEYDSLGRLISQNVYNKEKLNDNKFFNEEAKKQSRNYSYSKVGELLSIDDKRKGKTNYSYDRLGRIKETIKQNASNETKELFAFDPAHNLLNDENDQVLKNNQIETYQDKRFKYDTFGNLTNKKISNHTNMDLSYDAQNQLNTAKVSKNKIIQTYHYTYDPFGRRVTKTDAFGTTYFTWDGNRLLTQSRGDTDQSYIYEQFGFTPIASTNKQNELHYYHSDHLGTPQEVTNNQGEIVWEAEYATWGNTTKVTYKQVDANIEEVAFQPLRFQGQYYDAETGLHYNRFRYYDPDIGRFISQDPIGLMGGTNLYQYAPNPVGWVDPLGLSGGKIVIHSDASIKSIGGQDKDKIGHSWISITDNTTGNTQHVGYWPLSWTGNQGFIQGDHPILGMNSMVDYSDTTHFASNHAKHRLYSLNNSQLESVNQYVSKFDNNAKNGKQYRLLGSQCASFACGALDAAGINDLDVVLKNISPCPLAVSHAIDKKNSENKK